MNNILIIISVILNGILLAFLFGLMPLFLYLSVAVNVLLVWYIRKSMENTGDIEEDLLIILKSVERFSDNLDNLHSMEMFYGEPILQDLINHSRATNNDIVDMLGKYYDVKVEEIDEEDIDEEEIDEEDRNQEEKEEEPIFH